MLCNSNKQEIDLLGKTKLWKHFEYNSDAEAYRRTSLCDAVVHFVSEIYSLARNQYFSLVSKILCSYLDLLFRQLPKHKGNVITVGWVASLIIGHNTGLRCVLDLGEEHSDSTLIQLLDLSVQDWHPQNSIC